MTGLFGKVPEEVARRASPRAVQLVALVRLPNGPTSFAQLAQAMGCSERTMFRAVAELRRLGFELALRPALADTDVSTTDIRGSMTDMGVSRSERGDVSQTDTDGSQTDTGVLARDDRGSAEEESSRAFARTPARDDGGERVVRAMFLWLESPAFDPDTMGSEQVIEELERRERTLRLSANALQRQRVVERMHEIVSVTTR